MFKKTKAFFGAVWAVSTDKDIPKQPKKTKVKKQTKDEIAAHYATINKEKEAATKRKEPWVVMTNMEVDYDNLSNGSFELDWNDYFIAKLMKAGYQGKEDADLVDQWFNNVCRNVVLETYEQGQADPQSRRLDNGRMEYK